MSKIIKEVLKDRAFVIVGLVLLVSALGVQTVASRMKLHFRKLPVPLLKDLQKFDVAKMWPYKLVAQKRIPSEVEGELGTKDYVQMVFEDTAVSESAPGRHLNFFVTYYTGNPDQVPHVPDVCYLGGGCTPAGAWNSHVRVPGLGLKGDRLPVRILFYENTRDLTSVYHTVIYFFGVNGTFVNERMDVRVHLGDLWLKYAYFSKVELSFVSLEKPKTEVVLSLAEKFFRKAVPILVHEHWQDWESFIRKK